MNEIAYVPAEAEVRLRVAAEPPIPGPDEVLVRTAEVGFCGTDREIVRGGIAVLPPGANSLVLGHEMTGVVETVGDGNGPAPGTPVVCTVRRPCGGCPPCMNGRSDFCLTGGYLEHGITRLDGFARPFVLVGNQDLVTVPDEVRHVAVLAEPLSIIEKAEEQARHAVSRIPGLETGGERWGEGRRAVVAGAGPIGLLATYLLVERGFEVDVLEIRDPDCLSAQLVAAAGARYILVDRERPDEAAAKASPAEVVFEACGDPRLAFELLGTLGPGGVVVWIGTCGGNELAETNMGRTLLRAVLQQHAVVATINSCRDHFRKAVEDLRVLATRSRFGELITGVFPVEEYREAIWPSGDAIKQVVRFEESR